MCMELTGLFFKKSVRPGLENLIIWFKVKLPRTYPTASLFYAVDDIPNSRMRELRVNCLNLKK